MNQRASEEAGFTLVELLVALIIVGIIVFSLGTALLVGFRTVFAAGEKLRESNNAQLLSSFFIPDVQSAALDGIDITTTPSGCAGSDGGTTNVVRLTGTDTSGASYVADYRRNGAVLERHSCAPGGTRQVRPVVRDILNLPAPTVSGRRVTMLVTVDDTTENLGDDPYTFSVAGSRRTPGITCEPLAGGLVISPVSVALSTSNPGQLATQVAVTFATSGACTAATVEYQYGASGSTATATATTAGSGNWSATIPANAPGSWTTGTKAVKVRAGSAEESASFGVYDPNACRLTSGPGVAPSPGQTSGGALIAPLTVTFVTNGPCGGTGNVAFQYGDTPGDFSNVSASKSGNTWTATVPATLVAPAVWTPGMKAFNFAGDVATGSGTFRVDAAAACATTGSMNINPANPRLRLGQGAAGQLEAPVAVTFTTTGYCASASVSYQYGSASETASVPATSSGNTWSATLPVKATASADWTVGRKTITATVGGATVTGSMTVTAGCALTTSITFNPGEAILKPGNSGQLVEAVATSFTTTAACGATDLSVLYQYGSSTDTATQAPVDPPSTNADGTKIWVVRLPPSLAGTAKWTAGLKDVSVTLGAQRTIVQLRVNR